MSTTISTQGIVQELANYIRQQGGSYSAWYVGIAARPRERLFTDHNVDEKNGAWIFRDCGTQSAARAVEAHFLAKGCKGGGGGGDASTRYVYAYRITSATKQ